jgi:CubicO group peptidase (beta-lactamase class C family)
MPHPRFFAESPESVGIDPEKLDAVFDRAAKEVREGLLPSAQIAVARNGRLAGMRSFGSATFLGVEAPVTNDTLYCVFSTTKALTSAAAWLLMQEGKLRSDELVADIPLPAGRVRGSREADGGIREVAPQLRARLAVRLPPVLQHVRRGGDHRAPLRHLLS